MNLKSLFLIVIFASILSLSNELKSQVNTVQPSVMVVPLLKGDLSYSEEIRTKDELRIAISEVKNAFDQRGYTTKDFSTLLKSIERDEAAKDDNKTGLKEKLYQMAGTDIMVEVDLILYKSSSGNRMTIILAGNVTDNGDALATVNCDSQLRATNDFTSLSQIAIKNCLEPFLTTLNEKFGQIVENGQTLKLEIDISPNSNFTMESIVPSKNDELKYVIQDWLEESSYKNYVSYTSTENQIMVDAYKYPIRDPQSGRNNKAAQVERKIKEFFRSINVPVKAENPRSGIILITIQ